MDQKETQESKLIRKKTHLINTLRQNKLDFNHLFLLECFYHKEDKEFFRMYTIPSMQDFTLSTSFQHLKKAELLVENPENLGEFIISVKGRELYEECLRDVEEQGTTIITVNSKSPDDCFEEWWKTYPSSTGWKTDDGNTTFTGSRTVKNLRKPAAKTRYLKLLNQGYKHEDLLGSLLYEIKIKKLDSIKKGVNQMEFFKGMEAYLNQEVYLSFMDAYKDDPTFIQSEKIKGRKQNVTDI